MSYHPGSMAKRADPLPALGERPPGYRSGFVAVVGLPNAGKSTLVNAMVGVAGSIVSPRPQTTRNRIRCVSTTAKRQIVFVDTPGWLRQRRALDKAMGEEIARGLDGVDVVVVVVDAADPALDRVEPLWKQLGRDQPGRPAVVVLSKIDSLGRTRMIPLLGELAARLSPAELVPVSAQERDNLVELDRVLTGLLPEGPVVYPPDTVVDRPAEFLAAEFVREAVFHVTRQEVPYSTAVETLSLTQAEDGVEASLVLWVERESQLGILVGAGGGKLAQIRRRAEARLATFFALPAARLDIRVKVAEGWRENPRRIRELGIGGDD